MGPLQMPLDQDMRRNDLKKDWFYATFLVQDSPASGSGSAAPVADFVEQRRWLLTLYGQHSSEDRASSAIDRDLVAFRDDRVAEAT